MMELHQILPSLALLIVCLALVVRASETDPCPDDMFLQKDNSGMMGDSVRCVTCSVCEVNTIIRVPCTLETDTVCGPFFEFNFFHNERLSARRHGNQGTDTRSRDTPEGATVASSTQSTQDGGTSNSDSIPITDNWKELCFGLIGALAAVTSLALFYVFITHMKHRNSPCKNRPVTDAETPVVYYHSQIEATAPERGPALPHLQRQLQHNNDRKTLRRLFQPDTRYHGNEYVEELDDVKTCATPFLLHPIPEGETEHFPLAQADKNHQKHLERSHHYCVDGATASPHVTEMLLNNHTCDCDLS